MTKQRASLVRDDIRHELSGWTVIDVTTGGLAVIGDHAAEALDEEEAAEIVHLLNTLEFLRRGSPSHSGRATI
jgi:hypothetical protein